MQKKIHFNIIGKEKVDIVIEMGLGSCISEWLPAANFLKENHGILLYERRGINKSVASEEVRTPRRIANELYELLESVKHKKKIIFLAHSQGGLYIQQFARLYPEMVKGIVLLDPLSANDNQFKQQLTAKEYQKSGIDKGNNFKLMQKLAKLHLGFITKKILKTAPPLYYYNDFDSGSRNDILGVATNPVHADTAWKEYIEAHKEENIALLRSKDNFPSVPLVLITHSSELSIQESMQFGNNTRAFASRVEDLWQNIMKEYLNFTDKSKWIEAKNSTHYIHLTEKELILEGINWIIENGD